ncbi:MAG: hypothetical protein SGPRY_012529 [Prymnesium sp.]
MASFRVEEASDGARLVAAVMLALPRSFPSKGAVRRALHARLLLVDGQPASTSTILHKGQLVEWIAKPRFTLLAGVSRGGEEREGWLKCPYRDDWLAAVLKPAGVAVQGDTSATELRRAINGMLPPPNEQPDPLSHPQTVHRLDKQTSGLLLCARTVASNAAISMAFAEGRIQKTYLALLAGPLQGEEGVVQTPIHGKPARTSWRVLKRTPSSSSGCLTTVELRPETGRQHQLRRHMALQNCPILGDPRYMPERSRASEVGELYLHALTLELSHPANGEPLRITSCEPNRFEIRRSLDAVEVSLGPIAASAEEEPTTHAPESLMADGSQDDSTSRTASNDRSKKIERLPHVSVSDS